MTYIVFQREDTQAMLVGIDIGNQSDGYRLTVGGYSGIQGDINISNESDGYCLTGIVTRGCR